MAILGHHLVHAAHHRVRSKIHETKRLALVHRTPPWPLGIVLEVGIGWRDSWLVVVARNGD
jgi:hypothetical protein